MPKYTLARLLRPPSGMGSFSVGVAQFWQDLAVKPEVFFRSLM
jgi:hypothetical protein